MGGDRLPFLLPCVSCTSIFFVFEMVTIGVVAAVAQPVNPSKGALTAANNLHIVSMAILAYEYVARTALLTLLVTHNLLSYLITIPAEYRLYKTASRRR